MSEENLTSTTGQSGVARHLYGKHKDIEKMSLAECRERLTNWELLWGWVPEEIQFLISKIGEQCAFITTNEGAIYGRFVGFDADIKEYKLDVEEQVYDHMRGKNFIEVNTTHVKKSYVTRYKWLQSRVEKIEKTMD